MVFILFSNVYDDHRLCVLRCRWVSKSQKAIALIRRIVSVCEFRLRIFFDWLYFHSFAVYNIVSCNIIFYFFFHFASLF